MTLKISFNGVAYPVTVVDTAEKAASLVEAVAGATVALDTETTGLDTRADDFRVRLVQFATDEQAWVMPTRLCPAPHEVVARVVRAADRIVAHNLVYDARALEADWLLDQAMVDVLWSKAMDTMVLAHLADPKGAHGLEAVAAQFFGVLVHKYDSDLGDEFRRLGYRKGTGWAAIEDTNPCYLKYGAADAVLTVKIWDALRPLVAGAGMWDLAEWEVDVSRAVGMVADHGMLVDIEYLDELDGLLEAEAETARNAAASFKVHNVNSTYQVSEQLAKLGATLTAKTATGKVKVDDYVLRSVEQRGGPAGELAKAVRTAKRRSGDRTKYVEGVRAKVGSDGRVRAQYRSLGARTGRMSVSAPPLQQLPSGDHVIRDLFIAGPGNVLVAADYSAVELRVLAAVAEDEAMIAAFKSGADLHQMTADAAGVSRSVGKMANFLTVYGGGADALATQAGIDKATAAAVIAAYGRQYPGVKRLARRLTARFNGGRPNVVTPTGRVIPVDRGQSYAALNYLVQSTARDVFAAALLRLVDAGYTPIALIHDEVLMELPADGADEALEEIMDIMRVDDFMGSGVDLEVDGKVVGERWGDAYRG